MNKTHTTVYRWYKGKSEPRGACIAKLAMVLETLIQEIVLNFKQQKEE